jgi:hypothetical protein
MAEDKSKDAVKVDIDNVLNIAEGDLNDVQKQLHEQAVDNYKAACLQSLSVLSNGKVI